MAQAIGITILKTTPSTPVNTATNNRIKPNLSSASIAGSKVSGNMLANTLLPSRGGIGKRLKTQGNVQNKEHDHQLDRTSRNGGIGTG